MIGTNTWLIYTVLLLCTYTLLPHQHTLCSAATVVFDNSTSACGSSTPSSSACLLSEKEIWIGKVVPTKEDDVVIISTTAQYNFDVRDRVEYRSLYMQSAGQLMIDKKAALVAFLLEDISIQLDVSYVHVIGSIMANGTVKVQGNMQLMDGTVTAGGQFLAGDKFDYSSLTLKGAASITAQTAVLTPYIDAVLYDTSRVTLVNAKGSSDIYSFTAYDKTALVVEGTVTFVCNNITFYDGATVKVGQMKLHHATNTEEEQRVCRLNNGATVDVMTFGADAKLVMSGRTTIGDIYPEDDSGSSLQLNVTNGSFVFRKLVTSNMQVSSVSFNLENSYLFAGITNVTTPLDLSSNELRAVNSTIEGYFISPKTFEMDINSKLIANNVVIEQYTRASLIGKLHVGTPGSFKLSPKVALRFSSCDWDYGVQFLFDGSVLYCASANEQNKIGSLTVLSNSSWTIGQQVGWVNLEQYVQGRASSSFTFNGNLSISDNVTLPSANSVIRIGGRLDVSAAELLINVSDVHIKTGKTANYTLFSSGGVSQNFSSISLVGLRDKHYQYYLNYTNSTIYLHFVGKPSDTVYVVLVVIICVLVAVSVGFIVVGLWQRMQMKKREYRRIK